MTRSTKCEPLSSASPARKLPLMNEVVGEIGKGLVVLLGIARDDTKVEAAYLVDKIAALRIFDDEDGKMNLSVKDVEGGLLIVSQFTLYGDVRRGLRPSWIDAAPPEVAEPLYDFFVRQARTSIEEVATGKLSRYDARRVGKRRPGDYSARQ